VKGRRMGKATRAHHFVLSLRGGGGHVAFVPLLLLRNMKVTMLKIGDEVEVVVHRCEDYGVFARSGGGEEIFVTAPELSWSQPVNTHELLGKKITVKILRLNSAEDIWAASARHANAVSNPYREFLDAPPEKKFRAKVTHRWTPKLGIDVRLDNGARGKLLEHDENLKLGEIILVRIVEVDPGVAAHLVVQRV